MSETGKSIRANIVCTGCGLLCDDIFIELEGKKMLRCINACKKGRDKFQYYLNESPIMMCQRRQDKSDGVEINYEKAIQTAATIFRSAKHPLAYGFGSCSLEDQAALLEFVAKTGAAILSPGLRCLSELFQASRDHGIYLGTLGEAINKADVLIFWNADSIESHPRLISKIFYTRGLFRMTGYEVKKYVAVHPEKPEKFLGTTHRIKVPPAQELAVLDALAAIVKGETATIPADVNKADFDQLAALITHGEYVIIFVDKNLMSSADFKGAVGKILDLVNAINQRERAFVFPLPEDMNAMGIFQHISFHGHFPPTNVDWTQVDAILVGGIEGTTELPPELLNAAKRVPMVFLPQEEMVLGKSADVIIPIIAPGINGVGTAMRLDGVGLPLKEIVPPKTSAPTITQVIRDLVNNT